MKPIKKISATIMAARDLSPTARDIVLGLDEPLEFFAGSFVNLFISSGTTTLRRAFSISSSDAITKTLTLSIRLSPNGAVTPLFWGPHIIGTRVEVMGPLGLNTADKMQSQRIFLFGYGVGAGVVKALAEHFVTVSNVPELTIMTGSRSGNEILHKEYFDTLPALSSGATVRYVLSANEPGPYRIGYIQDHVGDFDFTNSDVYVCGQEVACQALVETIKKTNPKQCNFFIEGFH